MSTTSAPATVVSSGTRRGDRTLRRRLLTVPIVLVGFVLLTPVTVAALPLLAILDLVRGATTLPRARLAVFGLWYLAWEVVAVLAAAALWPLTGFGRRRDRAAAVAAHARLQAVWVTSLLGAAQRILRVRLDVDGAECLDDGSGPLIVLCRHASMVDTLVPAKLLFDRGLRVRYVLKDELLWDPALDIIGHRLPNYFVDRSSRDQMAEVDAIRDLAAGAAADDAVVIFPEGTRWSPTKRRRAIDALHRADPARAARAERLRSTMPPRTGGTLALLDGRPEADVVILRHTGLEGLAGPADAIRLLPLRHPVRVSLRRVPRSEVPVDTAGRKAWLLDQWDEVDSWIEANRAAAE